MAVQGTSLMRNFLPRLVKTATDSGLLTKQAAPLAAVQTRLLNLQEYASKSIMREHGIKVQEFGVAESAQQAAEIGKQMISEHAAEDLVVKAMILAGGRGKGTFSNGFKGGVKITTDPALVEEYSSKMLGHRLTTKQTPPEGVLVEKVMVCKGLNITRETYLAILMDREYNGPVIVASPEGGVDIEEVAERTPEKLMKEAIDIHSGISEAQIEKLAAFLEFDGEKRVKAAAEIKKLYECFLKIDATQVEINPFGETDEGEVLCFDAKFNFDDNAEFRQKPIFALDDGTDTDPRELEAGKYGLTYIPLDGNIACMVNGAGLAMATMDIIKLNGGWPANFMDLGGGVTEVGVANGFKLLVSDENVEAVLINIFGGIVNCATIARGITAAYGEMALTIPVVVRLEGTNVDEAKQILADSKMPIVTADNLDEAASKAVASIS